jgi:hypothetical protein
LVYQARTSARTGAGRAKVLQELVDAVLVDRDALDVQPVEVPGGVLPIVGQEACTTRYRTSRIVPSISNTMQSSWSG